MICTAVPTTSIHRLTSFLSFARATKIPTPTKAPHARRLTDLPDEILTCVFERLDSLSTIYEFALTNKKLNSIAATPRSLACWLTLQKGPRFSIYFALLTMPHLCDDHFLRLLINQGALISRHLVQQLVLLYGKSSSHPSLFTQCIERLPFSGYAVLIHQGFHSYGNILVNANESDYHQLMKAGGDWEVGIHEHCFLPAPAVGSYTRRLLNLATTRPDLFGLISPVFEFDRDARQTLWDSLFLLLLDVAFTQHPIAHHQPQLACLDTIITPQPLRFASSSLRGSVKNKFETDLDCFAHTFTTFFNKYPAGYCDDKVMHKLLSLMFHYLHPGFDLRLALTEISRGFLPTRKDIAAQLDRFLKNHPLDA